MAPSLVQRSLLILLERMGPYLAERISSAARVSSDGDSGALHILQDAPAAEPAAFEQPAVGLAPSGKLQPSIPITMLQCMWLLKACQAFSSIVPPRLGPLLVWVRRLTRELNHVQRASHQPSRHGRGRVPGQLQQRGKP